MMFELEGDKIIEVELGSEIKEITIPPRHVGIDDSCLDADLCSMGKFLLYYGEIETALKIEVERKEAQLSRLEAEIDARVRNDAKVSGEKLTEARIGGAVTTDPQRLALLDSILKSRKSYNMARWVMKALDAKRECLIALSYRENQLIKADRYSS